MTNMQIFTGNAGEYVFSLVHPHAIQMKHGHPGYDFILDTQKIDVKSARVTQHNDTSYWNFEIKGNRVPDVFCCIAFNRDTHPKFMHMWMIPIELVRTIHVLTIQTTSVHEWAANEILLDVQAINTINESVSQSLHNFEQFPDSIIVQGEQPNSTLKCSSCKKDLPLSEFYITTNYWHEKRGRTYRCKDCCRESARKSLANRKAKEKVDE